jgi:hypothetical protein
MCPLWENLYTMLYVSEVYFLHTDNIHDVNMPIEHHGTRNKVESEIYEEHKQISVMEI